MSLDMLEKKIRENGGLMITEIEEKSAKENKLIEEEIETEAKEAYQDIIDKGKKEAQLKYMQVISDARMRKKNQIDAKRADIVDRAFKEATNKILNLDDSKKTEILLNLASSGKKYVRDPIVYVNGKYSNLIKAEIREIGDFGVMIESRDGGIRIDNTLTNIIDGLKPDLKPKVAKILFQEQ